MKAFSTLLLACFLFLLSFVSAAQSFTHADTLRGSNGAARNWWDVKHYSIHTTFNLNDSSITGYNEIIFSITRMDSIMQIDLQEPLTLDSFYITGCSAHYTDSVGILPAARQPMQYTSTREDAGVYFIKVLPSIPVGELASFRCSLRLYYHGKPRTAKNAPWDGGMVFTKDLQGRPWISFACQGTGASCWFPCKDYQGDEPDEGVSLALQIPDTLVAIANGRLTAVLPGVNNTTTYQWNTEAPVNTYTIIPYIGKYVHFGQFYPGEKGRLSMDYWVLDYNLDKARKQFQQAPEMMKAFEYWFGPYPFYKDGYKLVDAPYLGMENQSDIAYGNGYRNGYDGQDLSRSGWGLKWDFIIVHESAHEWFGNNITSQDIADMWIHEGFANYAEALFTEYYYGGKAGEDYIAGLRKLIANDVPVIGPYGVNKPGSEDMYWKAANMLHTIRQVMHNDSLFRNMLRSMNRIFYHQIVTSAQIEQYISTFSGIDFSRVFQQYLRTTAVPVLEYQTVHQRLFYRWTHCVPGFDLPLKISYNGEHWINPTEQWQTLVLPFSGSNTFSIDRNFYVGVKESRLRNK